MQACVGVASARAGAGRLHGDDCCPGLVLRPPMGAPTRLVALLEWLVAHTSPIHSPHFRRVVRLAVGDGAVQGDLDAATTFGAAGHTVCQAVAGPLPHLLVGLALK